MTALSSASSADPGVQPGKGIRTPHQRAMHGISLEHQGEGRADGADNQARPHGARTGAGWGSCRARCSLATGETIRSSIFARSKRALIQVLTRNHVFMDIDSIPPATYRLCRFSGRLG
jgi:hypothetical protein